MGRVRTQDHEQLKQQYTKSSDHSPYGEQEQKYGWGKVIQKCPFLKDSSSLTIMDSHVLNTSFGTWPVASCQTGTVQSSQMFPLQLVFTLETNSFNWQSLGNFLLTKSAIAAVLAWFNRSQKAGGQR